MVQAAEEIAIKEELSKVEVVKSSVDKINLKEVTDE